ncbi:flagellar hook-basal body complex protein [Alphaproteobacteria bacterium]|nr:flagellar hook-basal body complex protein [Alphaproteobacteria bacterium]
MSFYTALTGLNGSQADISATSNNIANVATTGYKRSKAEFGDIFATSPLQNSSSSIGSGTILKGIKQQFTQGNVSSSLNALDMAISGQGFFALKPSLTTNQTVYTRNGSFSVNNDRYVVDSAGQFVLALPVSDDGSVQGGEITDAQPLKLELEAGEAKKTDNLELAINLPASSTVFASADDFDPKNPATFNSSTSVTIFDNLGNPVIATAYFIKTQAASGSEATHKYQTKFIVDGREVEPSLTEAISPTGQTLVVDRFGQIIPMNEKPQIISVAQTQPLFFLDDLSNKTVSKAATVTSTVLEDAAFTATAPSITVVTDPLQYSTTYESNPTLNKSTYWGKDFLTIRVDDTTGSAGFKSIDIRPGSYTAATLASEVQRAINAGLGDDAKLSIDPVTDGSFSIQFNQLDNNDEIQTLGAIKVDLMEDSFVTESLFSTTNGIENVASPNFTREEFLAHSQLKINDALNRAAVSADGNTNSASTYGVNASLFNRVTGKALSGTIKETEVLSFNYKNPTTDLTDENNITSEEKFLLHSYNNSSPLLKVFDKSIDVTAVSGNTMVQDASGTLKVYINDSTNTISSTSFPTEVYLAGEFDTTTSTINDLKFNGAKFSVSSAGTDANGNEFLNLKSDSTTAINITDTKIKVLHTESKDVSAYFEGGTNIFSGQTEHFGSNRIVLKELNKHSYLNKDVKQPDTLLNGAIASSTNPASGAAITVDTTAGFASSGTLLIGTEQITYTGTTATTFTGITRGANSSTAASALDDASVKSVEFTDGIISGFKDILRNTTLTSVPSTRSTAGGTADANSATTAAPIPGTNVIYEKTGAVDAGDTALLVDGGTKGIRVGDKVVGKGITNASYVSAVNHDTSTVTLSAAAGSTLAGVTATTAGDKVTFLSSAHTTGNLAQGGTAITVADATNIAIGDLVYGRNITVGTRVTAVSGTTITISAANNNGSTPNALSGEELNFVDIEGLGVATTTDGVEAVGQTILTVTAANNIQVGDVVEAAGVTAGTTVTAINGANITISAATTVEMADDTLITFLPADSESLTVGSTSGFAAATAAAPGKFKLGDEIITYTGKTATTLTGITRGAYNSVSKAVAASTSVSSYDSIENLGLSQRQTDVGSALTSTATTLTVDSTADFENDGFIRIGNELIGYTGKTATSFTGLTRGAGGTTAAAHTVDAEIIQDVSNTDDWVDETDPALKIAYDITGQNFTLQGIPSKIGTSTPSKMFSFSAFGPGEGNKANAIGLKTLSNKGSSNIGGGAILKAESVLFNGDQIAADTQRAYGVEVSYNNLTRKFSIASGSTGENIPANSAVGVGDGGQASSNIEIGRLAIVDGVATASNTGTGGTSALLGINATTAITTVTADTTGKGLQSSSAILNGKTSNEDLSEDFFLSDAAEETIFVVNANDITAAIEVPEGVYNGTSLATALQSRINQMEDSSGNTVNGVTVAFNTTSNSFTFTTGTTGLNSKIFVSGSSRMGLDNLELVTGTTPSFVNMATATASSATGQSLYVNDAGTTTTLAPENSWTATTDGTFAKVFLRPGELTFDTQGNLVSPIQKVGYKGDFAADAAAGTNALSIDLDLNFDGSTQFASDFNVKSVTQDGQTVGKLDGLDIAANGLVSANYTNGLNIALGRLVMVNFNNQNGLKQIGNATYVETSVSGVAAVGEAGADGYGTILSGSLERSNVDITEELVNLITAQRNFQANAKTIETNTTLTQAIIQIRT